jgi:sulfur carrier protein
MRLVVNGEDRDMADGATVGALVAELARSPKGMAVAVNAEVVPRSRWDAVPLRAGDRIEVLSAAQGG